MHHGQSLDPPTHFLRGASSLDTDSAVDPDPTQHARHARVVAKITPFKVTPTCSGATTKRNLSRTVIVCERYHYRDRVAAQGLRRSSATSVGLLRKRGLGAMASFFFLFFSP